MFIEETHGDAYKPRSCVLRMDVFSHYIRISQFGRPVKDALLDYCKRSLGSMGVKQVGRGRFVRTITKVYVGVTRDRETFYIHRNLFDELIQHLGQQGIYRKQIHLVNHELFQPASIALEHHDARTPREYQKPIIDYIADPGSVKVVTLDPGMGKTFIAMQALNRLGMRTFFSIRPMYIEKWVNDIKEGFNIAPKELMVVKGGGNLKKLTQLAAAGELEAKIILCSNKTFFGFLRDYETYQNDIEHLGYACTPGAFYETLEVGFRIIDEVHQDFHLNFRQDLYSHVPKTLSLSGTLESDDPFINRMYSVMFPTKDRYRKDDRKVYTLVDALFYRINNVDGRIKYINKSLKSYSHIKFEQSIMKQKTMLRDYLEMLADIVQKRFVDIRVTGQKIVIYFSTVELCGIFAELLKHRHPTLDVTRYVSEDDYEEMLECDVIVSTLKSLGTAIDIPGLRVAILTDALGSRQANLQCMGRLRELKDWPDQNPEFIYMVCQDIQKHLDYHEKKKEIFKGRVLRHREVTTPFVL